MTADSQGKWTGMNVEIRRGISAALFGDPEKVKYVPLSGQQRFTALQAGEVDLLSNNSTWTLTRDNALGPGYFVGATYYDGQGLHGAQEARREERQGVERRLDLRPDGQHVRAQHRRLLPQPTR